MVEPRSHAGRVAIVTGAARGIGQRIAIKLAARGASLVLVDLDQPGETAAWLGGTAISIKADIARNEGWEHVAEEVDRTFGRADIVVNNAGIYPRALIDDLDFDLWRKTLAVNLDAHFLSAKHFVPRMRKNRWGRFVNISSNAIGMSVDGLSHYMASKMGVIGFVRGLANDVGPYGITVNAILPAITNTPGNRGVSDEDKKAFWQLQAIKRLAEPEDIVGPVAFLTSDDAQFVTGQAVVVDGGLYKVS